MTADADAVLARARATCSAELPDSVNGVKTVEWHPESLTLADLTEVLGEPRALPPMPFADPVHAYPVVRVAGAPYGCTVLAAVAVNGRVSRITFRQEPPG